MERLYSKIIGSKLGLLLVLGWIALNTSSCVTYEYYTPSGGTFTGTTTFCQGGTATANTFHYTECGSGTGTTASGVACTVQWYYNTTGGTTIATSTALGAATGFTSAADATGTLNFTPLTTTPGVFYYFANITWGTGYCASPFTSGTQTITINAPPGPITGPMTVCIGSTTTLLVPGTGGTWHSGTASVATVTGTGVVTGVSPGSSVISYTATGCGTAATATVNVLTPPASITGPPSVCQGATITLSDATSPGTWSGTGAIASVDPSSGVVSGLTQGTATITFTSVSSCTSTFHVAVNAPPGAIAGPGTVCQGSSVTLTDPATGGTWSSSLTSVASVTSGSGIVTGITPSSSVITYTNGCGPSTSAIIGVNPLPLPITGATSLCLSSVTTLSDATAGGTWSSTAISVATVGSLTGIVSGVAAGPTTISYTIPNSCAATALITVVPPPSPVTGAAQVCMGQTTPLGATPAGGTWTSGNPAIATVGAASGIVTGVSMGTALITYASGVGCDIVRQETINPLAPVLGIDSVCQGLSTFLTNIVGGGNWSSSTPLVAVVTPDSGRVSGLTPGVTTITYLLPTGCQSSANVHVVSFPAASTGITQACPGTTANLSNATAGGVWSSNNNGTATVGAASGIVTGVSADTVSIFYTIQPGCAVSTEVVINPLPAPITGNIIMCPGTTDTLQDITPGGLWASNMASLATVIDTSGIVTAVAGSHGGSPVIAYVLPTGCLRTKTLSIFSAPVPIVTLNNDDMTFSTPNIYVSYQWYDSIVGEIAGATSYNLAALYNEYYYVVVTDSNGCQGRSAFMHYNPATAAGITNTTNNNGIRIYPNPTSGVLYIQSQVNVRAVVNGVDGKKVLEQANAKEINISNLAAGMYFITLYDDNNTVLSKQKFVKE